MDPMTIFVTASSIIILALLFSLYLWWAMRLRLAGSARKAAGLFVMCFALYAIGQTLVVVQVLGYLRGSGDVSSYLYALAALLFAVGSYQQYKSLVGGAPASSEMSARV